MQVSDYCCILQVSKISTRLKDLIDSDSSDEEKDEKSTGSNSPKEAVRRNLFTSSDEDDIFDTKKTKKGKKKSDVWNLLMSF